VACRETAQEQKFWQDCFILDASKVLGYNRFMSNPKVSKPDTLLRTDGTSTEVQPKNGTNYSLEELYELLGCEMIEVVYTQDNNTILICDEEGTFVASPQRNHAASRLAGCHIVGNVLACHTSRLK
jgi:hypothetical protein